MLHTWWWDEDYAGNIRTSTMHICTVVNTSLILLTKLCDPLTLSSLYALPPLPHTLPILPLWWAWIINIPTGWQGLVVGSDPVMVGYIWRTTSLHVSQGHLHISSWKCPPRSFRHTGNERGLFDQITGAVFGKLVLVMAVLQRNPVIVLFCK